MNELLNVIAANVQERRAAQGLSQAEAAEACGIERSQFNRIERANLDNPLSLRTLHRIAAGLGCGVWELLRRPG